MFKLRHISLLTVLAAAIFTQGCASMSGMETRDMASTPSRTFAASKSKVVAATRAGIENLGYDFKSVKDAEPTTEIYFSKPMSAFSWGEVGRIDVTTINADTTEVSIGSQKRLRTQITGTTEAEFAHKILSQVESGLKK